MTAHRGWETSVNRSVLVALSRDRLRPWLHRFTACSSAAAVVLLGAPVVLAHTDLGTPGSGGTARSASAATAGSASIAGSQNYGSHVVSTGLRLVASHPRTHPWRGHPNRLIRHYTVHRGDTATGLAVRFHAWTDELLAVNHKSKRSTFYVGERIKIPVVVSAARRHHAAKKHAKPHHAAKKHAAKHAGKKHQHHKVRNHGWHGPGPSRAAVRRVVVRTANRYDVNPYLALAVAWHESGWQQHVISSAHAVGVMQVLPSTGRWMETYTGHRLDIYRLRNNVTAGVVLLKLLRSQAGPKHAIAGYYQGLGSVKAYGLYDSTKHYVATVQALQRRLAHGWNPA
jgi:LysM repeat protein